MRAIVIGLLVLLAGCSAAEAPSAPAASKPPTAPLPVPVLKVGEKFVADLQGDGQATVIVVSSNMDSGRLAVAVKVVLDKAGKPIPGGPANFEFFDAGKLIYRARAEGLPSVTLATAGQVLEGTVYFDVPADQVPTGAVHLVTGNLVHAIWKI